MSISKRFLTVIFTAIIALMFVAGGEVMAQNYSGLNMRQEYSLTPRAFELTPNKEWTRDQLRAWTELKRAWEKKGRNRSALNLIKSGRKKTTAILESGGDATSDPEARKHLEDYTFPAMTQTDRDTLSSLGVKRQSFLENYLNDEVTGNARTRMVDFTIEKLKNYCIDTSLHPSSRVNAVVLLSQLTDRVQPPVASSKSTAVLQGIINGQDKKQFPDFLKIAALSGMKNQLEINSRSGQALSRGAGTQLVNIVMELLATEVDRKKDAGGYWRKRQAVQLSALLKDAKTLPLLLKILNDEVSTLEMKLDAVKAISQTEIVGSDPKTNSTVLLSVSKFAKMAVGKEAINIQDSLKQMEYKALLYGDVDLRELGADFEPMLAEESGFEGGRDFNDRDSDAAPLFELPNYQLNVYRNRIRSVALSCQQAIGATRQEGLRRNLDAKAEALASRMSGLFTALLERSGVGLIDVEGSSRRPGAPDLQAEDRDRRTSYVDQLTKVCEAAERAIADLLVNYTGN